MGCILSKSRNGGGVVTAVSASAVTAITPPAEETAAASTSPTLTSNAPPAEEPPQLAAPDTVHDVVHVIECAGDAETSPAGSHRALSAAAAADSSDAACSASDAPPLPMPSQTAAAGEVPTWSTQAGLDIPGLIVDDAAVPSPSALVAARDSGGKSAVGGSSDGRGAPHAAAPSVHGASRSTTPPPDADGGADNGAVELAQDSSDSSEAVAGGAAGGAASCVASAKASQADSEGHVAPASGSGGAPPSATATEQLPQTPTVDSDAESIVAEEPLCCAPAEAVAAAAAALPVGVGDSERRDSEAAISVASEPEPVAGSSEVPVQKQTAHGESEVEEF